MKKELLLEAYIRADLVIPQKFSAAFIVTPDYCILGHRLLRTDSRTQVFFHQEMFVDSEILYAICLDVGFNLKQF